MASKPPTTITPKPDPTANYANMPVAKVPADACLYQYTQSSTVDLGVYDCSLPLPDGYVPHNSPSGQWRAVYFPEVPPNRRSVARFERLLVKA